jgi:hypothetical protein
VPGNVRRAGLNNFDGHDGGDGDAKPVGKFGGSLAMAGKAIELSGRKDVRLIALVDPDLELLWSKIEAL